MIYAPPELAKHRAAMERLRQNDRDQLHRCIQPAPLELDSIN